MRLLGIDPGLHLTGYGCLRLDGPGAEPVLVEGGVLRFNPRASLASRLAQLYEELGALLDEVHPDIMVVEKLFTHHRHLRTSIVMGHARGVVLLAAQIRGIALDELAATEVKKAITGNGHASKEQIQRAVMCQLGLAAAPEPPDIADAIAIAMCAARRGLPSVSARTPVAAPWR
jgi:crossover junction endodeoxyribonuclease RuvC